MAKTDQNIKGIVESAIQRHSMNMPNWSHTHLWDDTNESLKAMFPKLVLETGELPILYCYYSSLHWTIFTSRAVIFSLHGQYNRILLTSITDFTPGNFKGSGKQGTELLGLKLTDGSVYDCLYMTGEESIGVLYAIKILLNVHNE
jgi:hypothetical protein